MKNNDDIRKIVSGYRPIDDDFMKIIFNQNNSLVQYVLRIILNKNDLVVANSGTQKQQEIWGSRSLIYDVLAEDASGKIYNIEFQKANSGASPKRARYHSGSLDARLLEPGENFNSLPDTYVIFITENDVLKKNQPTYTIERSIVGFNEPFGDGSHIVYVNCSYNDNKSEIGKLIHDFVSSNANEMLCKPLADVTRKYKESKEGMDFMCKAVEEYGKKERAEGLAEGRAEGRAEEKIETVKNLLKQNLLPADKIAAAVSLSLEEVKEIEATIS